MNYKQEILDREKPLLLVIDDDMVTRIYLEKALKDDGFDVRTAEDGEKGLKLYHSLFPDMLILDVMMPKLDGFGVCEAIQKIDEDIKPPIVMLTGLNDVESIEKSFHLGASDFIIKPVNLPIFKQRVRYGLKAREADLALYKNQARLAHAHKVARFGHWDWNVETDHLYFSNEIHNIFSIDKDSFSENKEAFLTLIHADDLDIVKIALEESMEFGADFNIDCRVNHSDIDYMVIHAHAEVLKDGAGKVIRMLGVIQDITERHLAQKTIMHQALHDSLTDLPNRTLFNDRLEHALKLLSREAELLAVLFIDFDRFKNINDTLGHDIGDEFLKSATGRLKKVIRKTDTVARLGGDEFAIILEGVKTKKDVSLVANMLIDKLSEPHNLDGNLLVSPASIGVALASSNSIKKSDLLRQADMAMYHSKKLGGNQYSYFSVDMNVRGNNSIFMENELRAALDNNQLQVFYQPKVSVETGKIKGMEALVRWIHPEKGIIPPNSFIPLAEECGLIVNIGHWVLEESCRQNLLWHDKGFKNLIVSVNISPMQFNQKDFFTVVNSIITKTKLNAKYLELEITESCTMSNVDETIRVLHDFRDMGIKISIDDFGTGYSSLSYLDKMPLDTLKVDRAFIKDITVDGENGELARLIIAMAKSLELNVITEGVETKEHLDFISKHGSNEYQGFLMSPPVPADKFEELLNKYSENYIGNISKINLA
jgi:diguanylate cyclase (GGDEF)-like protein